MRYTVQVAATAKADLAETFVYLGDVSPEVAERWLRDAEQAINAVGTFAGYGPAREAAVLGRPLRQRVLQSYRIVFSVDETDGRVDVIYVRHAARRTVGEDDDTAPKPTP